MIRTAFRLAIVVALSVPLSVFAYPRDKEQTVSGVSVDSLGVMRWNGTGKEVRLFGVNYTLPFAYSYRAHHRLGLSLKRAIDLDVAHFARLGLDGFRVHVWDREISDADGNLIQNEHLDLLDYLLDRLSAHGIKAILTPIAWWGTGWPEPDEPAPGFSQRYSKQELITNPQARQAERRYLAQFFAHVNGYRKMSYAGDPDILAIEIINEPRHPDDTAAVTAYINEMAQVLRAAGCGKPIFYNISENWSTAQAKAVARTQIDGVSFQWYPTGLVHGKMLAGDYQSNVASYPIPSAGVTGFGRLAKMVYEFDAADVGASTMYPPMSRSFLRAGMQCAAMFSYDPVQIAWSNTEYPTHFLNLLYTPSKAISLLIAGQAFHRLPRDSSSGEFSDSERFGDCRIDSRNDVSEWNSSDSYYYSNSTMDPPQGPAQLRHLAGCGNSPVVRYDGTGAYFLDRLEPGIWRLEVFPDVLWLRDPFGTTSMTRQVARLYWNERTMTVALPDLGENITVTPVDQGGLARGVASLIALRPGVYILAASSVSRRSVRKYSSKTETFLEGLYRPPPEGPVVVNGTPRYIREDAPAQYRFSIAADRPIASATLFVRRPGWRGFTSHPLRKAEGFSYVTVDSVLTEKSGEVEYCVALDIDGKSIVFPGGFAGKPGGWDFATDTLWRTRVLTPGSPFVLFDPMRDRTDLVFPQWKRGLKYAASCDVGVTSEETVLRLSGSVDPAGSVGFQLAVMPSVKALGEDALRFHRIIVRGASGRDSSASVRLILLQADGSAFDARIDLKAKIAEQEIPLSSFVPCAAPLLPEAYPLFLPRERKVDQSTATRMPDLRSLSGIQIWEIPGTDAQAHAPRNIDVIIASVVLSP